MRSLTKAFSVAVGTAALSAVAMMTAASADASVTTYLGTPSMGAACANQYPGSTAGYTNPNNAYSWGCYRSGVRVGGLNLNQQCTVQFGSPAYASASNPNNVWSWYCFR
jgi:hypothetical protein